MTTRLLAMFVALAAFALLLSACGSPASSSPSPSAEGALAGYWRITGESAPYTIGDQELLIAVEGQEGAYLVGFDGRPAKPATLSNERIVLPFKRTPVGDPSGGSSPEFGLDGSQVAVFALVSHSEATEPDELSAPFWQPFPVEELTAEEYTKAAAAKGDAARRMELASLRVLIRSWANDNEGLPAASDLHKDSALGTWASERGVWPVNPYTGEPMTTGTQPGQFTYVVDGEQFTLTGYLHDGESFSLGAQ